MNQQKNPPSHALGMNISSGDVRFSIHTQAGVEPDTYVVKPGQKVKLRSGYLHRRQNGEGSVVPAIVERLTNGSVVPLENGKPMKRVLWPQGVDESVKQRQASAAVPDFKGPVARKNDVDDDEIAGLDDVAEQPRQPKKANG